MAIYKRASWIWAGRFFELDQSTCDFWEFCYESYNQPFVFLYYWLLRTLEIDLNGLFEFPHCQEVYKSRLIYGYMLNISITTLNPGTEEMTLSIEVEKYMTALLLWSCPLHSLLSNVSDLRSALLNHLWYIIEKTIWKCTRWSYYLHIIKHQFIQLPSLRLSINLSWENTIAIDHGFLYSIRVPTREKDLERLSIVEIRQTSMALSWQ